MLNVHINIDKSPPRAGESASETVDACTVGMLYSGCRSIYGQNKRRWVHKVRLAHNYYVHLYTL